MSRKIRVSFNSDYLASLDNVTTSSHDLTEFQTAMLLQALLLLLNRQLWQDMTDSEWELLYYEISEAIGVIQT